MAFFDTQFALKTSDAVAFSVSQRTAIEMQVCVSIAFESTWLYKNLKHPRYKNFYGYAQLMSGAFVVEDIPLNFLNQELIYWFDATFGINETTGCYARAIASALEPSRVLVTNTVKTRQRYTSIRFRLLPGIVANVSYVWQSADPKCEGNVLEPDEKQGQPPLPDNSSASSSPRPINQGDDSVDPSSNDGDYNPNSGLPQPPGAGSGGRTGTWRVPITFYDFADNFRVSEVNTNVVDPGSVVIPSTVSTGLQPNTGGKGDYRLDVSIDGVTTEGIATGFGLQFFPPFYY